MWLLALIGTIKHIIPEQRLYGLHSHTDVILNLLTETLVGV